MALIVEDGTGLPNAEAYISVTEADSYFAARGNATWAALTTAAKEAALRLATDYMEAEYGPRWRGKRLKAEQALSWPRDVEGVPEAVRRANAELAVRASAGPLMADQGAAVQSETVGPISVTYVKGNTGAVRYTAVESALRAAGLLCVRPGFIPVVRA